MEKIQSVTESNQIERQNKSVVNLEMQTEALTEACHQYRADMAKVVLELDRLVAGQGANPDEIEKLATIMLQLTNEHRSVIAYNTEADI